MEWDILNGMELPVTISAWVYKNESGTAGIFSSDDQDSDAGNYYGFWMIVQADEKIGLYYGDGIGGGEPNRRNKLSGSTLPSDQWVHVVGVINGAAISFGGVTLTSPETAPLIEANGFFISWATPAAICPMIDSL